MEGPDWEKAQGWLPEHGYHGYDLDMSREVFRSYCDESSTLLVPHIDALPTID